MKLFLEHYIDFAVPLSSTLVQGLVKQMYILREIIRIERDTMIVNGMEFRMKTLLLP